MNNSAYIFDAIRTPRGKGKKGGALYTVKPITLVANLLNELKERNNLDTSQVEDIVLGCVTPVGDQGGDIAKIAALVADWDEVTAGVQTNRFCASGLDAINIAAAKVIAGFEDLVVAGGVESMSRIPMASDGGAMAMDPQTNSDIEFIPQGVSADLLATIEGFSREDVDAYALDSQEKAANAWEKGYFEKSIVPVKDQNGIVLLEKDELVRDTSMEALGNLGAAFQMMGEMAFDATAIRKYSDLETINHVHSGGNSSGIVDGSALVLIGSKEKGEELGLKPRGRIVTSALTSVDPTIMLTGPAPATLKALKKAGLTVDDIDLFEVNEAFAAVVMRFQKELNIPAEKINVNGGAIAMGHPLGATGAMIMGTCLDELERRGLRYGLCTLCVAGGMGIATIIERV
jgi:acetyl-CoA C-acetyltransferase